MARFTVKLAGIPINIFALYDKTQVVFKDYLTEEPPIFSMEVTEGELNKEREMIIHNKNFAPKNRWYPHTETDLEVQWLYHQTGERLPKYGVLLFHGSAVAVDGYAYLFTAPSGTGKSTHTRLWRQYFGDRAVMINDDKPLLKFEENNILVCGSPWQGRHRLGTNISVSLKGICLLTKDNCNSIVSISGEDAFPTLLRQCYIPNDHQCAVQTLDALGRLAQLVPQYRLRCNMELEAAKIAYMGMNGGIGL